MNFKKCPPFTAFIKEYWTFLLLPVLTFFFYISILNFDYVHFDEDNIIINNAKLLTGTSSITKVLTSDVFLGKNSAGYRPLQNLSFWIDSQLFGVKPFGYHLTNLILHVICSLLIMQLLYWIGKSRKASFLAASVFAMHPFAMMTIAWIPARGDLLLVLFSSIFLISVLRFNEKKDKYSILMASIFLFLALLSKETAFILIPLSFLLLFINKFRWDNIQLLKFSIALFIPVLVALILRFSFISNNSGDYSNFGFGEFINNIKVLPYSLFLSFIPYNSSLMETVDKTGIIIGLLILGLMILSCFKIKKENREITLMGLSVFIFMFLPTLFYSHELKHFAYDTLLHRLYLPIVGLSIMLIPIYLHHKISKYILIVYLHVFIVYSSIQMTQFKNAENFYTNIIKHSPESALAHNNYATYLVSNGQSNIAISHFTRAIEIKSDYKEALFNRANNYLHNGAYNLALNDINQFISLKPDYLPAYNTRGIIQIGRKDFTSAIMDFNVILRSNQNDTDVLYNRAITYFNSKQYSQSINDYTRLIILTPSNQNLYLNRGMALQLSGNPVKACEDWNHALTLGDKRAQNLISKYCR